MTSAVATTLDVKRQEMTVASASPLVYRLAGLAFATVLPALFWVGIAVLVGRATDIHLSATAMVAAGVAIAAFLGSVCAPIVLKN